MFPFSGIPVISYRKFFVHLSVTDRREHAHFKRTLLRFAPQKETPDRIKIQLGGIYECVNRPSAQDRATAGTTSCPATQQVTARRPREHPIAIDIHVISPIITGTSARRIEHIPLLTDMIVGHADAEICPERVELQRSTMNPQCDVVDCSAINPATKPNSPKEKNSDHFTHDHSNSCILRLRRNDAPRTKGVLTSLEKQ